jgi:predicted HNH restriction endonuclease
MKSIIDSDKCYFCEVARDRSSKGFRNIIELHHINEKNKGGKNEPTNLLPLCSNHHSLVHMGKIIPIRFYFSTKGWILHWKDDNGNEYYGVK